jgi:hypothetical protein
LAVLSGLIGREAPSNDGRRPDRLPQSVRTPQMLN